MSSSGASSAAISTQSLHGVAVHRRLVDTRRAGQLGGAVADAVDLDVVGVAVVAVRRRRR